jgi:hypothetical protein
VWVRADVLLKGTDPVASYIVLRGCQIQLSGTNQPMQHLLQFILDERVPQSLVLLGPEILDAIGAAQR